MASKVKSVIADEIISNGISALEIATKLEVMSEKVKAQVTPEFARYGFSVANFFIQSINFPDEDFEKINQELQQYSEDLAKRPMIVAANKIDLLPPDSDNLERLRKYVEERGYEFYEISAATTAGTKNLMRTIAGKLAQLPPVVYYEPEYVKPLAEAGDATELRIEQHEDLWEVSGPWIMKLLNDINFDDYESRMYFDRQLRKSGLFERLEEMGIEDGDTVSIYDFEFEYTK